MPGLSLVAASGGHSSSRCAASLVAEHRLQMRRLSSCGSRAQLLRGMWDLPRPGLEPVSPALAGRFSTTAPPGKPPSFNDYEQCCCKHQCACFSVNMSIHFYCVHRCLKKQVYHSYLKVFANSNIEIICESASIVLFFPVDNWSYVLGSYISSNFLFYAVHDN